MAKKNLNTNHPSSLGTILSRATLAIVSLILVFFFIWPQPKDSKKKVVKKEAKPSTSSKPLAKKTITPSLPPQKIEPTAKQGLGASLAQAPIPKPESRLNIPKDLNLGDQTITLRGGEWTLRLNITLSSEDKTFTRYAAPMRARLIQMTYFLVSHRVPEAMRHLDAEERLRNDLLERFKNVLRNREFELYFDAYELQEVEYEDE